MADDTKRKPEPGEDERGFKVEDRRRFEADGTARAGEAAAAAAAAAAQPPRQKALPPLDFSTFVLSLGTSAMIHLGEAPAPGDASAQKNLQLAQQSIDLLAILQEKTKGNLTSEEEELLRELLYDLRMKFVAARGKA
jgi:hypothetical protein